MSEEVKAPVEGTETNVEATPNTETVKSADEILKELKAEKERLEKRAKDQETFIGKQASEIGELRKKVKVDLTPKPEENSAERDALEAELTEDLKRQGYDETSAKDNAKILSQFGRKAVEREFGKRVMSEVVDMIEDALEEGKIDRKVFDENKDDVLAEFNKRKLAPTARKNFRSFKECYEIVAKRKADALRAERKPEDEKKREAAIGDAGSPPPAGREQSTSEEKAKLDAIRNAGPRRDSAFF